LICLKRLSALAAYGGVMPRFAAKALLAILTANRSRRNAPNWDRIVILGSTAVTVGLVALFAYGKATSRW
jgi:hypothetical protein